MAKKKATKNIEDLAAELYEIRIEKNRLAVIEKTLSQELRLRMESGERQSIFSLVPIPTLRVVDMSRALDWARDRAPQLITVDTTKAKKWFQQTMEMPDGMEVKLVEQLRVAKEELEVNEE